LMAVCAGRRESRCRCHRVSLLRSAWIRSKENGHALRPVIADGLERRPNGGSVHHEEYGRAYRCDGQK
jgi:hypothetical protein